MIDVAMMKRPALYKGETGLFPTDQASQDEFQLVSSNSDVLAKISSPKNIQMLKFIWALASKVADSVDGLLDKEDGLEFLCVKARFMRAKLDAKTGKMEIVRKSLSRASNETLKRLLDRMIYITVSEIIPGLDEGKLRTELAAMVGA